MFLIPQVWSYAGVSIQAGQPELIATHPDYRCRGLVRAQFEVIHDWGRAAGQLWQVIRGIAWYYRQFGYWYAVDLPACPTMWLGGTPPPSTEFSLRAAHVDVGFLGALEVEASSGTPLEPVRGPDGFALELARRPGGLLACEILVIAATTAATPIGYIAYQRRLNDGLVSLRALELRRGTVGWDRQRPSWPICTSGSGTIPTAPDKASRLALPPGHPAPTRCLDPARLGITRRVRAVYPSARCHRLPPRHRAGPEPHLAASPAVAWTGGLRVDLYQGGLGLHFDDGRLATVERWDPPAGDTETAVDARVRATTSFICSSSTPP